MKDRWMLFDKNGKLQCWNAYPTKAHADNYRLIGAQIWLVPPYYENGAITETGKKFVRSAVTAALKQRDEVRAVRVKLTKVAN